ncbi:TetR/AcrR family transcriptional regulator [Microbispora triticiradicis]|uniref:TetR/AcrR family transcriptional regulator n=2 Tax=Microbispora TaxID=2005 RepID=A0ABY3M3I4_9ACTN|nr:MULTISPECIES: TetR/AcrR family transcriptional regulator [Microbispora]TLP56219.1 TetR/AcrR family transcriptional regulator [Microbispora fusca]TYB65589.1 TetR/AcrR family transcriptional regulator [Microbispora tritici]
MSTAPLRKDAARNWQRIVEVGRRLVDEGTPIQLNDVARAASVGVATVYRHFPTPEALLETVATPGLEALAAHAERALSGGDPWAALRDFLFAAADAQVTDASISPVFAAPVNVLPHVGDLKERLAVLFGRLLERAHAAGVIDPSVTQADMLPLMCGVAFAATVHPATDTEDRAATARRYLTFLLEGLRTRA